MSSVSHAWDQVKRNPRSALSVVAAVLLLVAAIVLTNAWWEPIETALEGTHPVVFFLLLCVLPLGGVSITLLHVVVGAKFGVMLGLVAATVSVLVHLAGAHAIVHSFLRRPVERMLQRKNLQLPGLAQREPVAVSVLGALVPGIPYIARNYLLALSGIPFHVYALKICWPIHSVRSGVAIFFGSWAGGFTPLRVTILVAMFLVQFGICAAIVWHLHRKHVATAASRAG